MWPGRPSGLSGDQVRRDPGDQAKPGTRLQGAVSGTSSRNRSSMSGAASMTRYVDGCRFGRAIENHQPREAFRYLPAADIPLRPRQAERRADLG